MDRTHQKIEGGNMKYVIVLAIVALLLIGCIGEVGEETQTSSEIVNIPPSQLSNDQILEQYPDDLDNAIADLEILEE